PRSYAKRYLKQKMNSEWNSRWVNSTKGRWTAQFFPTVTDRKATGKVPLTFVATQFLSGHGKFGAYLHKMRCRRDPMCECKETQTCEHLLFECPLLRDIREELEAECGTQRIELGTNALA